ncbi:Trp biosynthesis-associated membrane protein [Streptomyces sp. SID13031]|uniref:Trp biosynthesis-associated membrane protein n=1 Tax=Streptomyces sp. SID13031 TaxID=2706046 RepID=UPI0013C907AF|nr:Trp biosynthesis-associated membrane protein [Streptomyces sp. SID13031]NEA33033.1 Trp biosynthesis-associated membrane protein [Streptomyces sp. SID13031]
MRPQRLVDLLAVVALALLGTSAYLTWSIADPGNGRPLVNFTGYAVTRAPVTLALAGVVAVIVTKLAGTALRRVLSGLIVFMGAAAVGVALQVRPDVAELGRLRPELSDAVTDSVTLSTGPAPWLALAGGVALLAAGIVAVLTAHRWRRPTLRYERDPAATPADQWKAIDAGKDPTI